MSDIEKKPEFFREFRHEIWRELRRDIDEETGGWSGRPITATHPPFHVVIDIHAEAAGYSSCVLTRFRAAYINRDGFRFRIKRRSWVMTLATMLGAQDIEIGDEKFDREFIIQANSSGEVIRLLKDADIRRQLHDLPVSLVEVRDDEGRFGPEFPGEVDELYLATEGRLTDVDALEGLYELFADILNRLTHIGSAYKDDPNITL